MHPKAGNSSDNSSDLEAPLGVLEWSCQNFDLSPNEMLWQDFKQAVHAEKTFSVAEFYKFCKEEKGRESWISSCQKHLVAVVATKGGKTNYPV